mgnify:CR=1 FL=1
MKNEIDWKQEAQKHAVEAGEMKIAIAQKLEEVRADIVNIRHMLLTEDTALDQAVLSWKKAHGAKKTVGKDWKQNVMQRFGRVE